MEQQGIPGTEAAKKLGVNYRSLMRLQEQGLIEVDGGGQHGRATLWTPKNIQEASVIFNLRAARISLQKIRETMEWLRDQGHNPFSTGEFVVISGKSGKPHDIIKFVDKDTAFSIMGGTKGQLVFPIWRP
jgi:DNA-binding transcriptional MerR regulator